MADWIDFKELRSKLSFEAVLGHYKVEIRPKGGSRQHMGYCPLPGHGAQKRVPSFSANLEKGIFHCFQCKAKGNLLDFAALMDGVDTTSGVSLRKTALALQRHFFPSGSSDAGSKAEAPSAPEQTELAIAVNPELDFELKGLDADHPYLIGRGFAKETIAHFGLGFCARGSLKDRVAIPLHDSAGALIGYAGRVVDDAKVGHDNPKYRMPGKRERNGAALDFQKGRFLYNGHRFRSPRDNLGVVEGFPSVWWLHQNGYPSAVATMGPECSDEQAALIVSLTKPAGRVWVLPSGNRDGAMFAESVLLKIAPHRFVRWVKIEDGKQPTDLSAAEMAARFKG